MHTNKIKRLRKDKFKILADVEKLSIEAQQLTEQAKQSAEEAQALIRQTTYNLDFVKEVTKHLDALNEGFEEEKIQSAMETPMKVLRKESKQLAKENMSFITLLEKRLSKVEEMQETLLAGIRVLQRKIEKIKE